VKGAGEGKEDGDKRGRGMAPEPGKREHDDALMGGKTGDCYIAHVIHTLRCVQMRSDVPVAAFRLQRGVPTFLLEVDRLGSQLDVAAINHLLDRVEEGVRNAQRNLLDAGLSAAHGFAAGAIRAERTNQQTD
jgi:hypothetical protein